MNIKTIKAMKWHKKALIDMIEREGIHVNDISNALDYIIDNLDTKRRDENPINVARTDGYSDGRSAGYFDGWDDAMKQCRLRDVMNPENTYIEMTDII